MTEEDRKEFLLKMYDQVWNNINRQINLAWSGMGVVLSALALFYFSEKQFLSLDFATSLFIAICTWLVAQVLDSSNWYNRNITIISNIEKIFLKREDLKHVHYYFGKRTKAGKIIDNLKIQASLAILLSIAAVTYHFYIRVLPNFGQGTFSIIKALPYFIVIICGLFLLHLQRHFKKEQSTLLTESPGQDIQP